MAAAETPMKAMGETLQSLIEVNTAGFAGIQSSLRKEFSSQNKLLGGYLGKNLQLIAEALTDSSNDLLRQMQADARAAKEAADEALRNAGADAPSTVEATDMSIAWSPLTIIAALTGFLVGFFQGFFGPVGTLMKAWGKSIKNFFGKPLKWGWTSFKDMLNNSKVAGWYKSVKGWFQAKAWDAKFKWAMFKDMLKNSKVAGWYRSVKAWFGGTIKFGWTSLANLVKKLTFYNKIKGWFTAKGFKMPDWKSVKALFAESTVGRLFTRIKAFFSGPTGAVIPKLKTLFMKSPIGVVINTIKGLFSAKVPGSGIIDDVMKAFAKFGSVFKIFKTLGAAFGRIFFFVQIFMSLFDFYTGFVETEGNLLDKILGGLKAAFVGFFGGFMDLGIMLEDGIKWIIKKIAGFFGFDEEEVAGAMESFSIFKPLKQLVVDVADWFVGLFDFSSFSAGIISAAKLLFLPITALLDLTGAIWDWFMELFGWKDENAPKDDRTLTTKLGDLLIGVWDWFMGLFSFGEGDGAGIKMGPYAGVGDALINMVTGIWDWFKGLFDFSSFGATLITAAKLLFLPYVALMDLVGGIWDWFMGLFGWEKAKITDDGQTVSGKLGDLLLGVWDWFLNLFGFGDGHSAEMPADDGQTVMGKLGDLLLGVWKWFKGLFGFGEGGGATTPPSVDSVTKTLANLLVGAWSWFKGLFGFSSPEEDADTAKGVGGFLKDLVDGVWGYFKKLFQFGSIGDVMKSYFNLLTFFPNIIKDAIAGVTSWLLELFGFGEAAKTVANAKNFSLGDMLFGAIERIWEWFKGLLDIDVAAIAKKIPGAETLLSWMGEDKEDKAKKKLGGIMKSDEGTFDEDQIVDIGGLKAMTKGMSLAAMKSMLADLKTINESDIMGKGDEIANWDNVQKTMEEGIKLAALQKESNGLSGAAAPSVVIQDNSNTNNSSQAMVIPEPEMSPGNGQSRLEQ